MSRKRRYTDKRPLHSFRPDPRHWTRKGGSWKQKVAYRSEDEAWEFLNENPKLKAIGQEIWNPRIIPIKEEYDHG